MISDVEQVHISGGNFTQITSLSLLTIWEMSLQFLGVRQS
jgi:hypothetical protein